MTKPSTALSIPVRRDDNGRAVSRDIQDEERQRRFALNLRAARQRARLTQAGMAKKLRMSDEVYARYERGKMWPSIEKLCQLCEILDCSADSLLGLDPSELPPGEPPPPDDPPPVRKLLRQLRKARPRTVRLVARMYNALDTAVSEGHGGGEHPGDIGDAAELARDSDGGEHGGDPEHARDGDAGELGRDALDTGGARPPDGGGEHEHS